MRRHAALLVLLSTLLASSLLVPASASVPAVLAPSRVAEAPAGSARTLSGTDGYEAAVLRRINAVRTARDLHPVGGSSCLDGLAESWVRHLLALGRLVHRDQSVVLSRCSMSWAGENIAAGTGLTPAGVVRAWLRSPAHRRVLLKPRARRAGVGTLVGLGGMIVTVLDLGDPL